jgi:hypothetical protein
MTELVHVDVAEMRCIYQPPLIASTQSYIHSLKPFYITDTCFPPHDLQPHEPINSPLKWTQHVPPKRQHIQPLHGAKTRDKNNLNKFAYDVSRDIPSRHL